MENLIPFTLFNSATIFAIVVAVLIAIFIYSDVEEQGYVAFIILVIFSLVNWKWGTMPFFSYFTLLNVSIYLVTGFLFSIIRTYFKGKELTREDEELKIEFPNTRDSKKANFNLKDHVFRWWFMWPISALTWIFGRLLKDLYDYLYDSLEALYKKIFNL